MQSYMYVQKTTYYYKTILGCKSTKFYQRKNSDSTNNFFSINLLWNHYRICGGSIFTGSSNPQSNIKINFETVLLYISTSKSIKQHSHLSTMQKKMAPTYSNDSMHSNDIMPVIKILFSLFTHLSQKQSLETDQQKCLCRSVHCHQE